MRNSKHEARLAQRIAHRWLYWEPWVVRHLRKVEGFPPPLSLGMYQSAYKNRISICLQRDLPWTTIVSNKLDDPFNDNFQFNLNAAVERRRQARERAVLAARDKKEKRRAHSSRSNL